MGSFSLPSWAYLTVLILLLTCLASFVAWYLSFTNARSSIYHVSDELSLQVNQRVTSNLEYIFEVPHKINNLTAEAFAMEQFPNASDVFSACQPLHLLLSYRRQQYDGTVFAVYFGNELGQAGLAVRSTFITRLCMEPWNAESPKACGFYNIDPVTGVPDRFDDWIPYDPRSRPWFSAAPSIGQNVYTPMYLGPPGEEVIFLTAVKPILYKNVKYVLAVDFSTSELNKLLANIPIAPEVRVFVLHASTYELIATRRGANIVMTGEEPPVRLMLGTESSDPYIRESSAWLRDNGRVQSSYTVNLESFSLTVQRFESHTLSWIVCTAAPNSVFMEEIYEGNRLTLVYTAVVAVGTAVVGFAVVYMMMQPLQRIAREMDEVADFDLETIEQRSSSRVSEVTKIQSSFFTMVESLKFYKAYLPDVVQPKESSNSKEALRRGTVPSRQVSQNIDDGASDSSSEAHKSVKSAHQPSSSLLTVLSHRNITILAALNPSGHDATLQNGRRDLSENFAEPILRLIEVEGGTVLTFDGQTLWAIWEGEAGIHYAVDCALKATKATPNTVTFSVAHQRVLVGPVGTVKRRAISLSGPILEVLRLMAARATILKARVVAPQHLYDRIRYSYVCRKVDVVTISNIVDNTEWAKSLAVFEIIHPLQGSKDSEWMYELAKAEKAENAQGWTRLFTHFAEGQWDQADEMLAKLSQDDPVVRRMRRICHEQPAAWPRPYEQTLGWH
eukprot:NODE_392_length_2306_cov_32.043864_g363_i0.p1 GENE.NODE_392_length_2306_cov_32.043864_g363_i0~~NODE_392_length_2306_cov_32.043864_g363_i0.p1  ORF type:complete len:755 (-),score=138.92 NODE_392_length_2306_cov_32.043864_g363_i0:40-2226(-)